MSRKTLSVCIVVKNEVKQMVDCINAIRILADEIVVVDTGSTDGTPNLISHWAKKMKAEKAVKIIRVGKKFHDSDGDFDFGSAKTYAFENATKDYVMWMDASDRVQSQVALKKKFIEVTGNKDVIITIPTQMSKKHSFNRLRIGPRKLSSMVGKVHEHMWISNLDNLSRIHINIPIINEKPTRDLKRNLRILHKEWDADNSPRNAFYLGNTYYGIQNYVESIKWFRKRVYNYEYADMYAEEYYKSLECIADCTLKITRRSSTKHDDINFEDVFDVANEMIRRAPTRFEGYYYLATYYMEKQEYQNAIKNFKKYTDCKVPTDVKLWLDPAIYNGQTLLRHIQKCKMADDLKEPMVPDEITDYGASRGGSYKVGQSQYEVGGEQTIF